MNYAAKAALLTSLLVNAGCASEIPSCVSASNKLVEIFTGQDTFRHWISTEGVQFLTAKKVQPKCEDRDAYVDRDRTTQCRTTAMEPINLVAWRITDIFETALANKSRSCRANVEMKFTSGTWTRAVVFPVNYVFNFIEDRKEWALTPQIDLANWKLIANVESK